MHVKYFEIKYFLPLFSNLESRKIGLFFSIFLHFIILLIAIGLPNFFTPTPIYIPNVIPIEIVNISEVTSIVKKIETKKAINIKEKNTDKILFNNSDIQEIQKIDLKRKPKIETKASEKITVSKNKEIVTVSKKEEIITKKVKPKIDLKQNQIVNQESTESLPTKKIKPKIKPTQTKQDIPIKSNQDIALKVSPKPKPKEKLKDINNKTMPKAKPEPVFNIASMLKDLRNEKKTLVNNEKKDKEIDEDQANQLNESNKENVQLSISEIDLLIQQLSSCWTAPAGAVIEKGMVVKIGAKIKQNRRILENSVRIIATNISKSNPFYGPITESAMRTLLNPECIPLKLPSEKYNLWKNLTITFDHSIMKGY